MGKKSAPPAPDYTGAARAQGAANLETARAEARLSNPSFANPFGTRNVRFGVGEFDQPGYDAAMQRYRDLTNPAHGVVYAGPAPDRAAFFKPGSDPDAVFVEDKFSPAGQQRFDQEQRIDTGLGNLGEQGLGYVQGSLNQPFDQSRLPAQTVNAGQTGQDALLSRIEPQIQQDREALRTQLYNQGISEGSTEATANAWRPQIQRENDLRMQAALHGINVGNQARQQGIQEQSFFRNEPLNMLNAVRSASPVNIPQFQNYQGANVGASPLFNAAQAQGMFDINRYGIQQGASNNMMQGLFGIGGALAGRNWG